MPQAIKKFGNIYVLLKYLGENYENGDRREDFVQLRAFLVNGTEKKLNLTTLRKALACKELKTDITYDDIAQALVEGISEEAALRHEIAVFISDTTQKDVILSALLPIVDFVRNENEFDTVYGNVADQFTYSGEKRQRLDEIKNDFFRVMEAQFKEADLILLRQIEAISEQSTSKEEIEKQRTDLQERYQKHLLFVTSYEMPDDVFARVLETLDFHEEKIFKYFYQNLTKVHSPEEWAKTEKERQKQKQEEQRQKVIEWIINTHNDAFIKMTLSLVFTNETSPKNIDKILKYLSDREDAEENPKTINLNVAPYSFNIDAYKTYKKRRAGIAEIQSVSTPKEITVADKAEYKELIKGIKQKGINTAIDKARLEGKLTRVAELVSMALSSDSLAQAGVDSMTQEIAKSIKLVIGNFDWFSSQKIKLKEENTGVCEADIVGAEGYDEQGIKDFQKLAQKIKLKEEPQGVCSSDILKKEERNEQETKSLQKLVHQIKDRGTEQYK